MKRKGFWILIGFLLAVCLMCTVLRATGYYLGHRIPQRRPSSVLGSSLPLKGMDSASP